MLHIVDSLGRLRFSSTQLKLILWLLKKLGVPNVPSYDKFRKLQIQVRDTIGRREPLDYTSQMGNRFSILDPRETVAMVSACSYAHLTLLMLENQGTRTSRHRFHHGVVS